MEKKYIKKIQTSGPSLKNLFLIVFIIFSCVLFIGFETVYGHGVGSETFPPVELNGKLVTLEVSSAKNDSKTNDDQQISLSLIDFDSKITLRDTTFLVKSHRGEQFLFEQEFKADNGFIVFNFVSEENNSIVIEENNDNGFFGSLLGLESRMVNVKGPRLSEGGLYKLDVTVLTAEGYSQKLDIPLVFNAGISIAQTSRHDFVDPNFGEQNIQIITYYDEISNFQYDPNSREISFFMPFDWSQSNINQTSVVHEELVIPKKFGDLLVSGFTMYVNGIQLSQDIVNIDDFFSDGRIVHFIIYQKELQNIFENTSSQNGMNFVIKPDRDYIHLSSVTDNGQFRIFVSWEPENLKSNSNAQIFFDVTDIFLKNKPIATNYELSITQNDRVIFEQNGISSDIKDEHNIVEFMIPNDISGIVNLNFKNLDNNHLAKATIPIVINRIITQDDYISIPDWIKNNAGWWSEDQISDSEFLEGIDFLFEKQIISVPELDVISESQRSVPSWVKNSVGWWYQEQISNDEFLNMIKTLVKLKIITI